MRSATHEPKPLAFVGPSRRELREMPDEIRRRFGTALFEAQMGRTPDSAKPLRGYHGAGVLELVEDFETDAYRGVYTVRFPGVVYVLHVFQKKSTRGTRTTRRDLQVIEQRLREAEHDYYHRFLPGHEGDPDGE